MSRSRPTCASTPASTATCTVIGAGSRVEIWDTTAWDDYLGEHRAGLRRAVRGGHPRPHLTLPRRPASRRALQTDRPFPTRLPPCRAPERMGTRQPGGRSSPAQPGSTSTHRTQHRTTRTHPATHHRPAATENAHDGADGDAAEQRHVSRAARPHPRPAGPGPHRAGGGARRRHPRHGRPRRGGPRALSRRRTVIGIDRDREALALAGERLARFGDRFRRRPRGLRRDRRRSLATSACARSRASCSTSGSPRSSSTRPTVGSPTRQDAPLDMRMDQTSGQTAADVLNTYARGRPHPDPARLRRGAVRPRIAKAVVPRAGDRAVHPLGARSSTCSAGRHPAASQRTGGHPAKRTFQALRIEVNDELECLAARRRGCDRRARRRAAASPSCPTTRSRTASPSGRWLPVRPRALRPVCRSSSPSTRHTSVCSTRGAEEPSASEQSTNPRSASARLRVAERTRTTKGARR